MKKKLVTLLLIMVAGATLNVGCGNTAIKETNTNLSTEKETEISTQTESTEEGTTVEEVTTVPETPVIVQTTLFAQKTANVRQTPDTSSAVVGTLSTNDPVIVNGDVSADGWYTVTYCNQTAYIKGSLLGTEQVAVTTPSNKGTTSANAKAKTASSNTATNTTTNNSTVNTATTTDSGNVQTPVQANEQPVQPSEQPTQPSEQPAQPSEQPAIGTMAGANATMSQATGQSGHWQTITGPDGNEYMQWVTD